ncbi:class I SAM-dependent methyltransferase [Nocardia sp. A7]|uniref:class I SAM-dependent methyltransferase n=1 Tax=Nocardia sp. A7 TaxID=2789274 RepID=UPI00397C23CD
MFLVEAAQDLRTTGAVAPSGRALAEALVDPVRTRGPRPLMVLEAGAGTGAVTRTLLRWLAPGSRLDIVEANPRFADRLRHLVQPYSRADGEPGLVRVHQGYVEELDPDCRYDVIVSGLPLSNFTPEQVATIMTRYLDLLAPGGTLTYFAYLGTRRARTLFSSRAEASRHGVVEELMSGYQRRHGIRRRTVWANLPPAAVWQLEGFAGTLELPIATPGATEVGR